MITRSGPEPGSPTGRDSDPNSPHRRAWDVMPWVLAGHASVAEGTHLREHLSHCADCRAEWALQQDVQAGLEAGLPTQWPSPEPALQRLLDRIDTEPAAAGDAVPVPVAPAASPHSRSPTPWTRWLAAAVLVQAVVLGASGMAWWQSGARADYRTLSSAVPGVPSDAPSPPASSAPSAPVAQVRLVPAPRLDFAALQALLAQTGLVVVDVAADGSHLGLAASNGLAATALAAVPLLRQHPGVRLAEPTAASTAPR